MPELPPVSAPGSYCEDVGAVVASVAAMIALHQAGDGDGGQVVDVSSILALAHCTEMALPIFSLLRNDQVRSGAGLYPLFPCRDGLARIVLPMAPAGVAEPHRLDGLAAGVDRPGVGAGDARRRPSAARSWPASLRCSPARTHEQVTAEPTAAGVRVTPVLTPPRS